MKRIPFHFRLTATCNLFLLKLLVLFLCFAACSGGKGGTYEKIDSVKIAQAFRFCKKNGYDTSTAFFVDMSIHSGRNRFFVWNFKTKKVVYEGLCCHGAGRESTGSSPVFSNENGSNCTSLGKYKVGIRSYSQWGIHVHYKLHGLESTNSNAFKRNVVLHAHDPVPESEIYPFHLSMGWSLGCPVVSNSLMRRLDTLLKNKKKPTLLWIYK